MKLYKHYSDVPRSSWRWKFFSPQELASRSDGELGIDEDALDKLEALRISLGRPLILNSAYRSKKHNAKVGGAQNSYHMKAMAFDVRMDNHDPAVFEAAARAVGFTGFGFYPNNGFMHIDTGPMREWGPRWVSKAKVMVTSPSYAQNPRADELPVEQPLKPETASGDAGIVGTTVAGGGVLAALMGAAPGLLTGAGNLSPVAQVMIVAGGFVALAALAFVFRRAIGRLAR